VLGIEIAQVDDVHAGKIACCRLPRPCSWRHRILNFIAP
jgi:hypothetical protein